MEKIIVSYAENWDCEGYHTTQNIRLSENLLINFMNSLQQITRTEILQTTISKL